MEPKQWHSMKFFSCISWDFPEKVATQHAILNLIVCQIKGEYQVTYLEHALCISGGSKEGKMIYQWRGASYAYLPVSLSHTDIDSFDNKQIC